jgi:alkanesulfonate monooxygenase SsuD/methylene tetrahydromethanopterin reductase-like flavin-dependent oxidoreductase (luciferase family)
MALAIIGGQPERFAPMADLYRRAAEQGGHGDAARLSINSHGLIADDLQEAADVAFPPFAAMMNRIGRERGWPPMRRGDFEQSRTLHGANAVGSPEEVAEKLLFHHEVFGHQRELVQMSVGTLAHDRIMHAIELFGTRVAPLVRDEVARRETPAA